MASSILVNSCLFGIVNMHLIAGVLVDDDDDDYKR